MSDNKKYYYMRLKEDFFDSEEMVILEEMPHGLEFQNIFLQLCLKSLKHEGRLMVRDRIPYSPRLLAKLTRHEESIMEEALDVFEELGMIEVMDSGAIYMSDIQDFIGASSTEAERKKAYRRRMSEEREGNVDKCPDKCPDNRPPETELELRAKEREDSDLDGSPSLNEVQEYCADRGIASYVGSKFYKYQEEHGWIAGGRPVTNWMSLLDSWAAHEMTADIPPKKKEPTFDLETARAIEYATSGEVLTDEEILARWS